MSSQKYALQKFEPRRMIREDDASTNKYVADTILVLGVLLIGALILNLLGVFYIDQTLMWTGTILVEVLIGIIQILGRIRRIASNVNTKYIIMGLICTVTFVMALLLNFFVILALSVPLIMAMCYHSRKLVVMALVGSLLATFLAPILSCYFKLWDVEYLAFLTGCIDPGYITGNYLNKELLSDSRHIYITVASCVAMPMGIFVCYYGVIILLSTIQKQDRYNQQIFSMTRTQDRIIQGMADIVENRDSSTGGHVKRTSEVVQILIDTIREDDKFPEKLDDKRCRDIIKTAPMHDLGKIAIEDAILTKPGKLTEEEFARIKIHPRKSYDIIQSILNGTTDTELVKTAQNIALYHHEKYNGSGYPTGKSGKDIPLEARIMAIADVYDALVSKRCYKAAISHDAAYRIIIDSMGSHFDPDLEKYFIQAHPLLAKYYNSLDA